MCLRGLGDTYQWLLLTLSPPLVTAVLGCRLQAAPTSCGMNPSQPCTDDKFHDLRQGLKMSDAASNHTYLTISW